MFSEGAAFVAMSTEPGESCVYGVNLGQAMGKIQFSGKLIEC